jgi:autotransporter translocation and assembly factor TamB
LSQSLQHPNLNGEIQLLNGVLQNAPLDLNRASGRITFAGEHATLEFLNGATNDVDFSLKGEADLRSSNDVVINISSTVPVFDTTTSVQNCIRGVQVTPVDITLAPTIQALELRGDLFGNSWKMTLQEIGTSPAAATVNPLTREFHFCTTENTPGDLFTFGLRARPQPAPGKVRKRARTR